MISSSGVTSVRGSGPSAPLSETFIFMPSFFASSRLMLARWSRAVRVAMVDSQGRNSRVVSKFARLAKAFWKLSDTTSSTSAFHVK